MTDIKIQKNKIYSYSQLQNIFNLNNKSGTQTIREISKYYVITKVRRGYYKINRELTETEKIEMQSYNKYRDYIEPIIYTMLSSVKDNSVTMDMHELMEETEIVNKDFNYIKWHLKECAEIIQQDEVGLEIFTKESEPLLKRIIRDILYEMNDRDLISVTEIPVIVYRIYGDDNKIWYTVPKEIIEEKDVQQLLEIKRDILLSLGLDKESELGYNNRGKFRDLIAEKYNGYYFYYKYNIILNKKGLTQCQTNDIIKLKKSFNQHIQNKLKKSKQGKLKQLTQKEKNVYIKYCIDTTQDYQLRNKNKRGVVKNEN